MTIETEKLKTVRNFAAEKLVTPQTVYNWTKNGKAQLIIIDGVKFIKQS